MNIKAFYKTNVEFYKPLSHILYFGTEPTTSVNPYSNENNSIQTFKLFDSIYKTIDLNNFFYSIFYLLVPSYIDFNQNLISEYYDKALKDYDNYDLFKQFNYRHKYNKQTVRNLLKEKELNPCMIQFCADYFDINIIFIDKDIKTIYSKIPTPYKTHIILQIQNNEYQPVFQENKFTFTSKDQITWIAFRKHLMTL